MPTQEEADAWAKRTTMDMIERFPIALDDDIAIVLANALATKVSWHRPFDLVDASELGGDWSTQVSTSLHAPVSDVKYIAPTEAAGLIGVHVGQSRDGLHVASVIAADEIAPADVHHAAHEIAAGVTPASLFDLPLGHGPAWTLREETLDSSGPQEQFDAWLPAWSAESEHDLKAQRGLGFVAAIMTLSRFLRDPDPGRSEAKQVAKAKFSREGFEAAAITAIGIRAVSAVVTERQVVRTAEIRFNRPYAVVAWAVGDEPWDGVPVFSAWVTRPEDAG